MAQADSGAFSFAIMGQWEEAYLVTAEIGAVRRLDSSNEKV